MKGNVGHLSSIVSRRKAFQSIGILTGLSFLSGFPFSSIFAGNISNNLRFQNKNNRILIVGSNNHWIEPLLKCINSNATHYSIVDSISLQKDIDAHKFKISISENDLSAWTKLQNYLKLNTSFDTILFCGIKNPYSLSIKALNLGYHVWVDRPVYPLNSKQENINTILNKKSDCFLMSHLTDNGMIFQNQPIVS